MEEIGIGFPSSLVPAHAPFGVGAFLQTIGGRVAKNSSQPRDMEYMQASGTSYRAPSSSTVTRAHPSPLLSWSVAINAGKR